MTEKIKCGNCGERNAVMVDIMKKGIPPEILNEGSYCPDCYAFIPIDDIEEEEDEEE
jgi:hypothetical protein